MVTVVSNRLDPLLVDPIRVDGFCQRVPAKCPYFNQSGTIEAGQYDQSKDLAAKAGEMSGLSAHADANIQKVRRLLADSPADLLEGYHSSMDDGTRLTAQLLFM